MVRRDVSPQEERTGEGRSVLLLETMLGRTETGRSLRPPERSRGDREGAPRRAPTSAGVCRLRAGARRGRKQPLREISRDVSGDARRAAVRAEQAAAKRTAAPRARVAMGCPRVPLLRADLHDDVWRSASRVVLAPVLPLDAKVWARAPSRSDTGAQPSCVPHRARQTSAPNHLYP